MYTILHENYWLGFLISFLFVALYIDRIRSLEPFRLYELIRCFGSSEDIILNGFSLRVGNRSLMYMEDIQDLLVGEVVEEDVNSFCYVAGFDAFACGVLFLDYVYVLGTSCPGAAERSQVKAEKTNENSPVCKYLGRLLKGEVPDFKNKIYKAPDLSRDKSSRFLEQMQEKKELWEKKRAETQRNNESRKSKMIVAMYKECKEKGIVFKPLGCQT